MLNKTDIRSSNMQKALRSPLKSKKIQKRRKGIKRTGSVSTKDSEKVAKAKKKLNKKIADRYKIKSKDNKSRSCPLSPLALPDPPNIFSEIFVFFFVCLIVC